VRNIFITSLLIPGVILFIFFEISPSLRTPIVQGDEAGTGIVTLFLMNNIPDGTGVVFFGRYFPLSYVPRHGALESYMLLPFLLLGGVTPEALRIGPLLFGVITIVFTYWFGSRFFNQYVGAIAAFLLAINGFFVSIIKMGGMCGFSILTFSLIPLLLFLKYSHTKRNLYFYLGMFLLGLGFNVRGYFIWFIIALFFTGLLLYRRMFRIKICCIGFICLFIGALPVLYHYFKINLFRDFILANFIVAKEENINNLHFFANLLRRIDHLNEALAGRLYESWRQNSALIYIFWICIVFFAYKIILRKKTILPRGRIVFVLVLTAGIFIVSSFTFSTLNSGHLILVLPYLQVLIAIAIWEIHKSNKVNQKIALLIVILFIGLHLNNSISKACELGKEERDNKNSNIYVITQWLLDNKVHNVVLHEEPFCQGVQFLSNLKLSAAAFRRQKGYLPEESIYSCMKDAGPGTVFILEADTNSTNEKINKYFKIYAKELNKEIDPLKKFYRSDGSLRFTACRLK